jgi:hypothetical protein
VFLAFIPVLSRETPDQVRGDGSVMKPLNVFPMVILLIAVILLIIWLRPQ